MSHFTYDLQRVDQENLLIVRDNETDFVYLKTSLVAPNGGL